MNEETKGLLFSVTDEFPGHVETVDLNRPAVREEPDLGSKPLEDDDVTIIEKSNLLLLGPSGVGKTYSMYQAYVSNFYLLSSIVCKTNQ